MVRKASRLWLGTLLLAVSSLSVAAAPGQPEPPVEDARLVGALKLKGELFHVQGVEIDGPRIFVTSLDQVGRRAYLHEFDRATGAFRRRIDLTDGARYHPGGISLSGRSLWIPVAEMKPESSASLIEVDADTFAVRRRIEVADHIGCIAASGQRLVAGNWDSRLLYVFDLKRPGRVRTFPNPSPTRYQDMKFAGDALVAGGNRDWMSGTVDWIDLRTMQVTRTMRAGSVGTIRPFGNGGPFTGEGMALQGRDLYFVPEDGPSRLFHFRLED